MPYRVHTVSLLLALLAFALAACGASTEENNQGVLLTAQSMSQTMVAVQLTELAEANPSSTPTPSLQVTKTKNPQNTPTPLAGDGACLAARLSDESVPDDSLIAGGSSFEKTWVLTNIGTCTWTEDYGLAFHHGNAMNAVEYTPLAGWVTPGQSVILSLDMVAPVSPGSHIGFWSLQSPDGAFFGPSANGTFWVRITVPGPTPTSKARDLAWSSGGSVRTDGQLASQVQAGDDSANNAWRGFVTFNFGNLADDATVTSVVLDLSANSFLNGDPFSMGCLNVYLSFYGGLDSSDYGSASGSPLWTFCSQADLSGGARYGGQAAIQAVQDALPANQIQLAFQFENQTNNNGSPDTLRLNPNLSILWYKSD